MTTDATTSWYSRDALTIAELYGITEERAAKVMRMARVHALRRRNQSKRRYWSGTLDWDRIRRMHTAYRRSWA